MIKHTATAPLPVPASEVDLEKWLSTMTDEDYQASAKGHRAAGFHRHDDRWGLVIVESVGGALIIQHHHAAEAGPSHVEMLSPKSTSYLMHLVPVGVHVRWVMTISPTSATTSTLTCGVEIGMSGPVQLVGRLFGTSRAIRRHNEEQTTGFAAEILRKARDRGGNTIQPRKAT